MQTTQPSALPKDLPSAQPTTPPTVHPFPLASPTAQQIAQPGHSTVSTTQSQQVMLHNRQCVCSYNFWQSLQFSYEAASDNRSNSHDDLYDTTLLAESYRGYTTPQCDIAPLAGSCSGSRQQHHASTPHPAHTSSNGEIIPATPKH